MADKESPDGGGEDLVGQTLDEHAQCMRCVAELESCLDQQPDREGRWVARLLETLPSVCNTLRAHFEGEQSGPMFRKLPLSHPRFAQRLEKLEAEHDRILEMAEHVIEMAGKLQDARLYEIREVNAQAQLLVATIRRHEAEENEVVMEANWDEVGVGD